MQRILVFNAMMSVALVTMPGVSSEASADSNSMTLDAALETLQTAKPDGTDGKRLAVAWKVVSNVTFRELPKVFASLDEASSVGTNWIGTAVDSVVETQVAAGKQLPTDVLQSAATNPAHSLRSRQLALELIDRDDSELAAELRTQFLTDPQASFRRPAIQAAMQKLKSRVSEGLARDEQIEEWTRLFAAVRNPSQAAAIAKELKQLDHQVDIAAHFGVILRWFVIGPFDNPDGSGFDKPYAPESSCRSVKELLTAVSKSGGESTGDDKTWKVITGAAGYGEVDLNKSFGKLTDVLAYGAAIVESDKERDVEIRLRLQNAFKIWVNGDLVMEQPIGHTGNSFDQYILNTTLRKGQNVVLIKSCQVQPIQKLEFFDTWHFSARVCDSTGGAIDGCRVVTPEESE